MIFDIIHVDLSLSSSLDFSKEIEAAEKSSHPFYFELNLGLFDALPLPLSDEGQLQSLSLGIAHFDQTLLTPFLSKTLGVILYRGFGDLSLRYSWEKKESEEFHSFLTRHQFKEIKEIHKKLFCQELCAKFFQNLLSILPEEIPVSLHFERSGHPDEVRLLSKELFSSFELVVSPPWPFTPKSKVAILLPSVFHDSGWEKTNSIFFKLERLKIPFKAVSELFLTHSWDKIGILIVVPEGVSAQGERKLAGFAAAEGEILFTGSLTDQEVLRLREILSPSSPASLN